MSNPVLFLEWEKKFEQVYSEYVTVRKTIEDTQRGFETLKTKYLSATAHEKAKVEQETRDLYSSISEV